MLVLSRKSGESFLIGENIEVFILDVQSEKIKVGIAAPADIRIIRNELRETERANRDSASCCDFKDFKLIIDLQEALLNQISS
ncbi:MAG: carbon storage regulator [Clostridia bacterium]|nr:carbon storage regulator [Clostridia bacterium]MDD4799181.1 carbon storage regulator [Clostridia bacterium]